MIHENYIHLLFCPHTTHTTFFSTYKSHHQIHHHPIIFFHFARQHIITTQVDIKITEKNLEIKNSNLYLFYLFMLTMRQTYLAFNFLCRRARYIDLRLYTLKTPITGMTLIFLYYRISCSM